jgi:fimbrial chaperone protein
LKIQHGNSFLRSIALLCVTVATLVAQTSVWAGVFSVTPVRIYITPKDRAVAVTITNQEDSEIVLQADIYDWSQDPNGEDKLTLTEDLLLSPPIIKLGPNARQVVRLALLAPHDTSRQMTYRMVIREVPKAVEPEEKIQVPIALALNMPVFVTPPAAKRDMDCTLNRGDKNSLQVLCGNTGTAYAQIREAVLKRGDKELARYEGGEYILPGAHKTFNLNGAEEEVKAGPAELSITFDDNQVQAFQTSLP